MQGRGRGCGGGQGREPERARRHAHDKEVFHRLLDRHHSLRRTVEKRPDGIRSLTRSSDPEVVALLHDHVPEMHRRLEEGFPLRRWDPLYRRLFGHADSIEMQIELLPDGVAVIERSNDPAVVPLIHAHADAVDSFVARGHEAAARESPYPGKPE